jgi:uncharacterized protein YjiS (DUF1127 family)
MATMTHIAATLAGAASTAKPGTAIGLKRVATGLKTAWSTVAHLFVVLHRRRMVSAMGELSDHELSDIGLVRSDLEGALAGRFLDDPTQRLNATARRPESLQRVWY